MPSYAVAGMVISTPFPIVELPDARGRAADWTVVRGDTPVDSGVEPVFELRTADDVLWATLGAGAGDGQFSLRYEGQVDFAIDARARTVTYVPRPGLADNSLRHLLIDQVVPHLLAVDGELVLHASAVALDGAAVAFIGPSGMGKSSLAAGWVQEGAPLLADDFLLLHPHDGGYAATAAYPGLRLWSDSAAFFAGPVEALPPVAGYTEKRRWTAPRVPRPDERVPLRAIALLGNPPEPGGPVFRAAPLRGADAFVMLYQQAFRVARSDPASQQADLRQFTRLAETVPVLLLEYRRDYAALPEVCAGIRAALAALPAPAAQCR